MKMANIQSVDFQAYVKQLIAETVNRVHGESQCSKMDRPAVDIGTRRSNQPDEFEESQDD